MNTVMKIKSLKELTPGQTVHLYNRQFDAQNRAIYLRGDATGLGREIGYFRFDRGEQSSEFAIWQRELDCALYSLNSAQTIPIADLYTELLNAVNRGDMLGAKQFAAQIAA